MRGIRSLSGKLFILVTVCLLMTVVVISLRNTTQFLNVLVDRQNESTRLIAKDATAGVVNTLDHWAAQTALVMHEAFSTGGTRGTLEQAVKGLVFANRDVLAVEVHDGAKTVAQARTDPDVDPIRFEDKDPTAVFKELDQWHAAWFRQKASKLKTDVAILATGRKIDLPVLDLCLRFRTPDGASVWAVLTVWTSPLIAALPRSQSMTATILRADGEWLADSAEGLQRQELKAIAKAVTPALVKAKTSGAREGASFFETEGGGNRIGAWTMARNYGLAVLVIGNADLAKGDVRAVAIDTASWTWVILLSAMFVSYLAVSATTRRLKEATLATERIAAGDFSVALAPKGADEVATLSRAVTRMARQIQDLLAARVEAARQEKELETARLVQETLFPKTDLNASGICVAGRCQVASECGGDWWGHFATDDGLHCIVIADATGHGAPAALVMALAYAACNTIAETYRDPLVHRGSVSGLLGSLNRLMWSTGAGKTTMTALALLVNPRTGEVVCGSAGHCMPYHLARGTGVTEPAGLKVVKVRGAPLGFEKDPGYREQRLTLGVGDKLVLYTDGLVECTSAAGERWGKRGLEKTAAIDPRLSAATLSDAIVRAAFTHFGAKHVDDDVTVVVIERTASTQEAAVAPAA